MTVKSTLKPVMDRWEDPGDYPSGAGSGPLPSYDYIAELSGDVRIELTEAEAVELRAAIDDDGLDDWISARDIELPNGVLSVQWEHKLIDGPPAVLVLTPDGIEIDPDYSSDPYDD